MTNKEIIKALECCGKNHITGSTDACEHCFLQNSAMCVTELIYKALDLIIRYQAENERLQGEIKEKTRMVFEKVINKFLSIKDLYVVIDGETVPWEPIEEIEYLFGMTLSGENEEIEKETDRVIKELLEVESNGT